MLYETYQAAFQRSMMLAVAALTIGGVGFLFGVWGVLQAPEARYFVAQRNGQILPVVPLDRPFLDHAGLRLLCRIA